MDLEELKEEIQSLCWEIAYQGETLDARALTSLAKQNGWREDRQESSHHQFKHPDGKQYSFTLAYHGKNGTFNRSVVKETVQTIFQPQIDRLLQRKKPHAIVEKAFVETIDRLLDALKTAISPENVSRELLERVELAFQEAMQRIEAYETQRLQEAELAGQDLVAEQILHPGPTPIQIRGLQNQLDQALAERKTLLEVKQGLEDELCLEHDQKAGAYQQLQRLERQILDKDAEIAALKTQQAALQKALEQSQVEIATQYTQARTLEKELRAQIEASQREAAARHTNGLRQELETAQAKQVQAERGQLEQQFRKRESALRHTISTLQARLDQSSQEIASLQRQMQAAQADKQTAELALHNLQQRRQELEQHDNALLRAQLTRLESKNQTQAAQVKALQDQLTTLIAAKQHVEATVQQLHTQVNQAQSERVQLQNRLSEFERLEDDHQAARAKASRDIERLETELAESKARLATAVNQRSIQQWLSEVRTQMQARGVKRWLVRAAVAVAVFCVSWISQVM